MRTHFASIDRATESDNTEYAKIACDPDERTTRGENGNYTDNEKNVDCGHCLNLLRPTPPAVPESK